MRIYLRRRIRPAALPVSAVLIFVLLALAGLCGLAPAQTGASPTLAPVAEEGLPKTYRAGSRYTLRLRYTDPNGDPVRKNQALFIDEGPSGRIETPASRISGDTASGATIEWDINGFEQGAHKTRFEVTNQARKMTRYPEDPAEFYEFVGESLTLKWGIMAGGAVVLLLFLPFLVYVLARSMNRRGDPSKAARVGLLIGILACAGLFIYLFASFYGPLAFGIGIIAALALFVLVLTRR